MKILLGGVPFGRDNVGDEAILECVAKIVREVCPDARLVVSTDDPQATAEKLHVETVELFGFTPPYSRERMKKSLRECDVFIWSGATGLSDYPEIPTDMLRIAQDAGRKTVLWGVGMNEKLNPALYSVYGKRAAALKLASALTFNTCDFIAIAEQKAEARAKAKIKETLGKASLVVLRDPESVESLKTCGEVEDVIVGADSALILDQTPYEQLPVSDAVRSILDSNKRKIGICISAQREVTNTGGLLQYLDTVTEDENNCIVFLPMNPVTDAQLMRELQKEMKHPDRSILIEGRYEPADVLAMASKLDLIVSSRLHLLILASIVHTPIIGISRGTKVDNFLRPFGLKSVGSCENCDFKALYNETLRLLEKRAEFEVRSREVRADLLARLNTAKSALAKVLLT